MAHPPYMNATGMIPKIFGRIAEAQRPERFTLDYLTNVIGFGSGSGRPIIPLLKRLNFLQTDGTPTPLYARFRNPSERASATLEALRIGYPELYARSEYAHALPRDKLRDLVVEVTGLERENQIVIAIVGTIEALKTVGGVNASTKVGGVQAANGVEPAVAASPPAPAERVGLSPNGVGQEIGMNLSYTINLNLPATPDPEVFNAIFKALKEHLLGR
jgi:uncharacterized protein DUF5343